MTLVACSLPLVACFSQAWSLQLGAIDLDPGAKLGPTITHNLELSCDSQQLWPGCMFNFYCEAFHLVAFFISFMSSLTSRRISSIASAILFNCFVSIIFLSLFRVAPSVDYLRGQPLLC